VTKDFKRAATVVAIALVSGIFIGVAADHAYLIYKHRILPSHMQGRPPHAIAERLSHKLDLTPQQRTAIEQILERRHARVSAMWGNVRPQIRKEIDETNAEIEKLLTPAQKEKFAEIKKKMERRANELPR
jgi:Spy/CpxP family protein refolding chaperone